MPQFLFSLLTIFSGAAIGAGLFAVWCLFKLWRMETDKKTRKLHVNMMATRIGLAGTYGILLALVIPSAEVTPSAASWAYISFLSLTAWGLIGLAASTADLLAEKESARREDQKEPTDRQVGTNGEK